MNLGYVLLGFAVSLVGGAVVIGLTMAALGRYVERHHPGRPSRSHTLVWPMAMLERLPYTAALWLALPEWIAVWLGLKTFRATRTLATPGDWAEFNASLIGALGAGEK